jgi:hypothetical protein
MKWGRVILVIFGALIVTALGIDAADTLSGKDGTLLSQVIRTEKGCGAGMVKVEAVPGVTCVDQYEASPNSACLHQTPTSMLQSQKNVENKECLAQSVSSMVPWGFVTRDQAMQLCARSGKRLPTASEWYGLSLGMTDVESVCNLHSGSAKMTGAQTSCSAPYGAYDLVGNLWEWVVDDVINGSFNNRALPQNGYVEQVDSAGIALMTSTLEQDMYERDYFWSSKEGAYGMVRGGYYDSGSDGGVYAVHADTPANAANIGIGFRCVK